MTSVSINNSNGLTDTQAAERLLKDGPNQLESTKPKSFLRIATGVLKEPMFILLVSCGLLYLILGSITESSSLLAGILIIIGITFYQERKTERALEELKKLASPKATVIRNNSKKKIPSREVVVDDVIVINEGQIIPADAVLVRASNLMVDESILTGESVPVTKEVFPEEYKQVTALNDSRYFIYSGTMTVNGTALARVTATGNNTQLGMVGKSLGNIQEVKTPLQIEMGRLVRTMAILGLLLCALLVLVYYLTRGNFLDGLLAGLALAMAMLPEEFPVVFTIFMALGAWRMSKKQVLVRKSSSIEALGTVTILCTDKTGTITQNKMQVSQLYVNGEYHDIHISPVNDIPENFHQLIEYSVLASKNDPFDPMEKSIQQLGQLKLADTEHIHNDLELVKEYPLSPELLSMTMAYLPKDGQQYSIATKGAPEVILKLCKLPPSAEKEVSLAIKHMAGRGLRVLGIAKGTAPTSSLPGVQTDLDLTFLGLIGLSDPIRAEVPQAVKDCYTAGVRIILITGDYPVTAQNIAREAGITNCDHVMTGNELDNLPNERLKEQIKSTNIFARINPVQKLRIVEMLQENGEVVAMTGDGVNDAPALKAAHVGVSMGEKGTDVARSASSLILLDDNFASIVSAIKMGRKIFDNLQKAFRYIISIHIPIAGLALIPVLIPGMPILMWPVHIAFNELIIDPMSSVVFEQEEEEKDIMLRPPRNTKMKFFGYRQMAYSISQGVIALGIIMAIYLVCRHTNLPDNSTRAVSFITLILINLSLALCNLSKYRFTVNVILHDNKAAKWILVSVFTLITLILVTPGVRHVFLFSPFPFKYVLLIIAGVIVSVTIFELMKFAYQKKRSGK